MRRPAHAGGHSRSRPAGHGEARQVATQRPEHAARASRPILRSPPTAPPRETGRVPHRPSVTAPPRAYPGRLPPRNADTPGSIAVLGFAAMPQPLSSIAAARHAQDGADSAGVNSMRQLVQLRWIAVAGQLLTISLVHSGLDIPLPLLPMFGVLAVLRSGERRVGRDRCS